MAEQILRPTTPELLLKDLQSVMLRGPGNKTATLRVDFKAAMPGIGTKCGAFVVLSLAGSPEATLHLLDDLLFLSPALLASIPNLEALLAGGPTEILVPDGRYLGWS